MMDMVLGTAFFVCATRFAELHQQNHATAVIAIWALFYMTVSKALGFILTPKNSTFFMIASGIGGMLISVAFMLYPGLNMQFVFMSILAVCTAFFFVSFQVFMKAAEEGETHGLTLSTALYTFSWSTGMATGPFVSGYIWDHFGWRYCYLVSVALSIGITFIILYLKAHIKRNAVNKKKTPETEAAIAENNIYKDMPDLAWLGWIGAGVCCFSVSLLKGFFPNTSELVQLTKTQQGNIFALLSYSQAVTGLLLFRSRFWMYNALPVSLYAISAIVGLLIFAGGLFFVKDSAYHVFIIGSLFFGIYSGAFYFYFVFHSLVHPEKSAKYVSTNEVIVGFAGIAGPLLGGLIATSSLGHPPVYIACAMLTFAAMILQIVVHRKYSLGQTGAL